MREFIDQAWAKKEKEVKAPHVLALIANFNKVSVMRAAFCERTPDRFGVITSFSCATLYKTVFWRLTTSRGAPPPSQSGSKSARCVLSFVCALVFALSCVSLLLLLQKCREIQNFSAVMSIIAGLGASPVDRLALTWSVCNFPPTRTVYFTLVQENAYVRIHCCVISGTCGREASTACGAAGALQAHSKLQGAARCHRCGQGRLSAVPRYGVTLKSSLQQGEKRSEAILGGGVHAHMPPRLTQSRVRVHVAGMYLGDLTFIEEGNILRAEFDKQLIHFAKHRLSASVIQKLQNLQRVTHSFHSLAFVQDLYAKVRPGFIFFNMRTHLTCDATSAARHRERRDAVQQVAAAGEPRRAQGSGRAEHGGLRYVRSQNRQHHAVFVGAREGRHHPRRALFLAGSEPLAQPRAQHIPHHTARCLVGQPHVAKPLQPLSQPLDHCRCRTAITARWRQPQPEHARPVRSRCERGAKPQSQPAEDAQTTSRSARRQRCGCAAWPCAVGTPCSAAVTACSLVAGASACSATPAACNRCCELP